ncbi:MAG TPA: Rieske 2Fe-2S domain-containing protein [Stellaceae bacterium]|nr:Rieske 2Fe-2S domain-containing protein [Stellaceae bacterium]
MPDTGALARKTRRRFDFNTVTRTGPGTLAGGYMRRFWHPVWRSRDLAVGAAVPVRIMGEDFTLYRGESGAPHAVAHRCAHRRTMLSAGFVEGDCIRCLYHGWKYDSDGRCVDQPAELDEAFADKVRIRAYPTDEYLGLIFVHMGDGAAPPPLRFPEFEAPGGLVNANVYSRACNYYQNIENGVDEAHLPFTHRRSIFDTLNRDVPRIEAEERPWGLVAFGIRSDGTVREQHLMLPNMLSMSLPNEDPAETDWRIYVSWRVPVDDESHKTFIIERLNLKPEAVAEYRDRQVAREKRLSELPPADEVTRAILAGKMRLHDAADRPDFLGIQDHVAQVGQGAIEDRDEECLGRSDRAIVLLRKLWERDLRALQEGREPTRWVYPESLSRPKGV